MLEPVEGRAIAAPSRARTWTEFLRRFGPKPERRQHLRRPHSGRCAAVLTHHVARPPSWSRVFSRPSSKCPGTPWPASRGSLRPPGGEKVVLRPDPAAETRLAISRWRSAFPNGRASACIERIVIEQARRFPARGHGKFLPTMLRKLTWTLLYQLFGALAAIAAGSPRRALPDRPARSPGQEMTRKATRSSTGQRTACGASPTAPPRRAASSPCSRSPSPRTPRSFAS